MNPFGSEADTLTIRHVGDIYPAIGDGRYQFLIIIAGCIATIPIGMQEFMLVFLAFNPGWKCEEGSKRCLYNGTILPTDDRYVDRCSMNRSDWRYIDTKGFSIVNEFGLICGMDFWIYTSSSVFYLGNVIGALVSGWLSDKIGRTRVLLISYIMVLMTGLITSFLPNLWLFELIRVLTGIFVPGTYMVMVVLSSEIVSEKYRPAASIVYWMFYSSGVALLGVKAFYLHSWRKLLVYGSVPYLITIILLSLLPESFVWLHVQGREEELKLAIKKIAKINKKKIPSNISIKGPVRSPNKEGFSLFLLFKPMERLYMTLPMMFTWFAIGLIYFGESLAANNLTGNEYRDFVLLAVVDIPAAAIAIVCAMKLGRKRTAMTNVLLSGLCISLVGLFPETKKAYNIYRLIFGISAKLFCSVTFDVIVTWCAELYPTKLRSNANGLFNSCLIFGGMCAPWVSGYLHNANRAAPFFAMGSCMVISFILLSHIKETKGKRLPQRTNTEIVHQFEPENIMELCSGSRTFEEYENDRLKRTHAYIMNLERISNMSSIYSNSPNLHIHSTSIRIEESDDKKLRQRPRTGTIVYRFERDDVLEPCKASPNIQAYDNEIDIEMEDQEDRRTNITDSPIIRVHSSASEISQRVGKERKKNQFENVDGLEPCNQQAYNNEIDIEIEDENVPPNSSIETINELECNEPSEPSCGETPNHEDLSSATDSNEKQLQEEGETIIDSTESSDVSEPCMTSSSQEMQENDVDTVIDDKTDPPTISREEITELKCDDCSESSNGTRNVQVVEDKSELETTTFDTSL